MCEHACVCVQGLRDRVIITSWVLLDFKQRDGKEKRMEGGREASFVQMPFEGLERHFVEKQNSVTSQ